MRVGSSKMAIFAFFARCFPNFYTIKGHIITLLFHPKFFIVAEIVDLLPLIDSFTSENVRLRSTRKLCYRKDDRAMRAI